MSSRPLLRGVGGAASCWLLLLAPPICGELSPRGLASPSLPYDGLACPRGDCVMNESCAAALLRSGERTLPAAPSSAPSVGDQSILLNEPSRPAERGVEPGGAGVLELPSAPRGLNIWPHQRSASDRRRRWPFFHRKKAPPLPVPVRKTPGGAGTRDLSVCTVPPVCLVPPLWIVCRQGLVCNAGARYSRILCRIHTRLKIVSHALGTIPTLKSPQTDFELSDRPKVVEEDGLSGFTHYPDHLILNYPCVQCTRPYPVRTASWARSLGFRRRPPRA